MPLTRTLLAMSLLTAGAAAQAGGFVDGDLYLATRALDGSGSQDGGVVAIDPLSLQSQALVDFSFSPYSRGTLAFDSYRKRLVFSTAIDIDGPQYGLWTADAAGQLEQMVDTVEQMSGLAPTGDGRLYVLTPFDSSAPFQWFDAANRRHVLLDETGAAPYFFGGIFHHNDSVMTYDAGTNALFVAFRGTSGGFCAGGLGGGTTLRKLPLSADGTRVVGPVECREFQADLLQATEIPSNFSRGPGGTLVLVVDTPGVSSQEKPRVAVIEPHTFSVSVGATPGGFTGSDQLTAGAWSSARNQLLLLDTLHNVLRGYTLGGNGLGQVLSVSGPLSSDPGSGELATLVEIDNGPCAGGFQAVGVGLAGAGGRVPALLASGCATLGGPLTLSLDDVVGGAQGLLFVGFSEGALPFRGGTLFMGDVSATLALAVPGALGVPGAGSLSLPTVFVTDPLLAGHFLLVQAGFADPSAVLGASLTQAVRIEID